MVTLHSFASNEGTYPEGALIQAKDGNFYGTAANSGSSGYGTVFRFSPGGSSFTVLHSFTGANNGSYPSAGLTQGTDGNFYGTTAEGGSHGDGTVFELTASGSLTTLYSFSGGADGAYPYAPLFQGTDGYFYGTTASGGSNDDGTVFKITSAGSITTLVSFDWSNGDYPCSGLIQATDGNYYGTTFDGGATGRGTVYKITQSGAFSTFYSFLGQPDGSNPIGGVIQGADGNLYGTTEYGGSTANSSNNGYGTIFELTGTGVLTTLHSFTGQNDGGYPLAGVIQGTDGGFHGTTSFAGAGGQGTAYDLVSNPIFTPVGLPFTYQITAANYPTGFNASGLPLWLSVNTSTGLLSGIPPTTGSSTVTISASNLGGTGTAAIVITVVPVSTPPTITSSTTASGLEGQAFSYQITATNNPTGYGATGLPAGLGVAAGTGLISGTPTATGTSYVTIYASNAVGSGSAPLTIVVTQPAQPPQITSPASAAGTVGSAFSYQITATNRPTSYNANPMPSWLGINTATGLLTGTPTGAGTSHLTIYASNPTGTGSASLQVVIQPALPPAPTINSATAANVPYNAPFSYQITATNSPTSYSASGLPSGLGVDSSSGVISGVTTSSGVYNSPSAPATLAAPGAPPW